MLGLQPCECDSVSMFGLTRSGEWERSYDVNEENYDAAPESQRGYY